MRITSLTSRLVAAALLAAVLAACSGDDSASVSSTTRVTEDPAVVAKERMCEALQTYAATENRRPSGRVDDANLADRLEQARSQALANLKATLTAEVPASVDDALDRLAAMPIQAASTTTAAGSASTDTTASSDTTAAAPNAASQKELAVVTDALDPICGTDKGMTPTSTTSTEASTATTAGGTSSTSGPANSSTTTSAP